MKTFAFGTLEADTDTWLLASDHVIALDVNSLKNFDSSLEHERVSVIGTMGIPPSSPEVKLIVENMASHEAIKKEAFEIYQSGQPGTELDHWLRAEQELLNM